MAAKDKVKQLWHQIDGEALKKSAQQLYQGAVKQSTDTVKELYKLASKRRLRLAVTGLSNSGKTVFITSLVNQLLEASQRQHRLPGLTAIQQGRYLGAVEAQQPDSTVPTFRYAEHCKLLTAERPQWPQGTTDISQLRLHIRTKPAGIIDSTLSDQQNLYLDITDYPGEWLVDLAMLELDFATWSRQMWQQAGQSDLADLSAGWRALMREQDVSATADRERLEQVHKAFCDYLLAAKAKGYNFLQPGRVLLPGILAGSPAVTFCPCLPPDQEPDTASLYGQLATRFEMYKKDVIQPFYRDHFAKFDCQVVLVDLMYALQQGKAHFDDTSQTLNALLQSFQLGRSSLIARLFNPKIDRVLFAVTKADQVNQGQYLNLQRLLDAMLRPSLRHAEFNDIRNMSLALAAIRATETVIDHDEQGEPLEYVRGRLLTDDFSVGEMELYYPDNAVPDDLPNEKSWHEQPFVFHAFHPPPLKLETGQSYPHINMDKALQFLVGDKL